ncbi:MAG: hypothetical protein WD467_00470 [Candidatus Saccharimonadales bacterium]
MRRFVIGQSVIALIAVFVLPLAYQFGPVVAFGVALGISWIPMQLIARLFEHRSLWPPRSQYRSFFWGDLLLLPGIAACIALAVNRLPAGDHWFHQRWWNLFSLLVGVIAGLIFHEADRDNYSSRELNSPTKLWHDWFVYPVFTYYLLSRAPALFERVNGITVLAIALLAGWLYLGLTDGKRDYPYAHVGYHWGDRTPSISTF